MSSIKREIEAMASMQIERAAGFDSSKSMGEVSAQDIPQLLVRAGRNLKKAIETVDTHGWDDQAASELIARDLCDANNLCALVVSMLPAGFLRDPGLLLDRQA